MPALPSKPAAVLAAILLSAALAGCGESTPRTTVELTISERGDMALEGRAIAADALVKALVTRRMQGDSITLLIRAEPTTSYDKVGTAMTRASEAGIVAISFKPDLPPPHASSASDAATR